MGQGAVESAISDNNEFHQHRGFPYHNSHHWLATVISVIALKVNAALMI